MEINICIPTLNSYDTLRQCIESVRNSSTKVNKIFIVDNGNGFQMPGDDLLIAPMPYNLGVAGSWNWFIDNIPEYRIISNDDVIFEKYAIERLIEAYDENRLVCPGNLDSHFSCFLLPGKMIEAVGKFDEWISPRYGYFEDNDYSYRMGLLGLGTTKVEGSLVTHEGSSTIRHFNKVDSKEHHDKFRLARDHYVKKWGGEPGDEKFRTPFGR